MNSTDEERPRHLREPPVAAQPQRRAAANAVGVVAQHRERHREGEDLETPGRLRDERDRAGWVWEFFWWW